MQNYHRLIDAGHFRCALWALLPCVWLAGAMAATMAPDGASAVAPLCTALSLPVESVGPPPTAYREFCRANAGDCRMQGLTVLPETDEARNALRHVNSEVNAEIRFMLDRDSVGEEEVWRYPVEGRGDCEDIALEKRRRLVELGLPRAALTMAIVHHKAKLFSHAVLLAETTRGTLMLDNLTDEILCWNLAAFNFETRERPDGQWDRFDQRVWIYNTVTNMQQGSPCTSAGDE